MQVAMITHLPGDLSRPAGAPATASITLLKGLARRKELERHAIRDRAERADGHEAPERRCTVHPVSRSRWLPDLVDLVVEQLSASRSSRAFMVLVLFTDLAHSSFYKPHWIMMVLTGYTQAAMAGTLAAPVKMPMPVRAM